MKRNGVKGGREKREREVEKGKKRGVRLKEEKGKRETNEDEK